MTRSAWKWLGCGALLLILVATLSTPAAACGHRWGGGCGGGWGDWGWGGGCCDSWGWGGYYGGCCDYGWTGCCWDTCCGSTIVGCGVGVGLGSCSSCVGGTAYDAGYGYAPNSSPMSQPAPAPRRMPPPPPAPNQPRDESSEPPALPQKTPGQTSSPTSGTSGAITVYVPEDAKVLINGRPTKSTGSTRKYVSHNLVPGAVHRYVIQAQVVRDGKTIEETRTVLLKVGSREEVAFALNGKGASDKSILAMNKAMK